MGSREEIQKQIAELRKQLENLEKEEKEAEERKQSLKEPKNESHSACEEGTSGAEVPNEDIGISTEEQGNEQKIRILYNIGIQSWRPQNFNKREGISNDSGTMYEVKICCLIFLKLMRLDAKFFLCSNLKEAGDFDDVVVWYSYNLHNFPINESLFMQLKHSENRNERSIGFLDSKSYFDIKKFFLSYCSINAISDPGHPVFRSDPEDRTFIIYTNSDISAGKLPPLTSIPHLVEELLHTSHKSDVSTLHLGEEDENIRRVLECLKHDSVKYSSLEPHPDTTWMLKQNCAKQKSFDDLKKYIRKNETFRVNSYMNFTSKTLMCYNQMNVPDLDKSIKEELEKVITISPEETERAFRILIESVKNWREKESYYLTENDPLWADIARYTLRFRFDRRRSELLSLGVRYKQEELTRLQKELSQGCRVYSVECSGKLTTATTLKVLQVLEYTGESYVLVTSEQYAENKELVLKTWLNKWCSTLIIEIKSNYMLDDDLFGNLYKALAKCTSRLITIFPRHNDMIAKIFQNTVLPCKRVIDSLAFNQFDRESQNRITSKKFNFQGQLVSLTDIIETEALNKLPQDVLSRLFFDNDVTIGRDISEFEMSNYIPRYLEIPHISEDILYQNNGDVIAVETITPQISTTNFLNKGKEMDILSVQRIFMSNVTESLKNVDTENHVVLEHLNEKSHFEALCRENNNFHWIKECNCQNETPRNKSENVYNTDKTGIKNRAGDYHNFIWKKSKGNITTVKRSLMKSGHCCFDELTFISQDRESPVLITGESGIGKSCLLKNLARFIKQRFPTKWVVFVDLPQHCDFKNTLKTVSEKDVDNILETSLKLSDADIDFWKETRTNLENCVILLDAYDEMCPHYAEQVKQVIRYLNSTSCFLYIATRRSAVADLENELSVISYNVKLLNQDEGTKYFKEIMMSTSPISEEEAYFITGQVIEKYSVAMIAGDTFLMSNPLHIKLLAEIYLDIIEEDTNILNIYQIYSAFLEKKVVQMYKKANSDINNPAIKYQLKFFKQQFNDYNKSISAEQIFPGVKCSTMGVTTVQNEISNMCQKVGVIDEIVDGKIKFVHRSFTDYFASLWLKDNYKDHHALVIEVMCKSDYDMIKIFYDMSLSEGLPLHSEALSRDEDRIESLLSGGADVNSTDKMQRTPLHLAASYNHVKTARTLLENSADIRLRDALDWTPTDYAIKTHSWETLDFFLGAHDFEETEKMEISKRIFQTWRENICRQEVIYKDVQKTFDMIYICCCKGLTYLLEIVSKDFNLNQIFTTNYVLDKLIGSSRFEMKCAESTQYVPLHLAVENNQLAIVSDLIEKYHCDADTEADIGTTALIKASQRGNIDIVKSLVRFGADIDHANKNGITALHYACSNGRIDIVKYFISEGVNINVVEMNGFNALFYACAENKLDIIRYCVEHGLNINSLDKDCKSLLMFACEVGYLHIVKYCVENGVNINHADQDGTNALMVSCSLGEIEIVKYLLREGANIDAEDTNGGNALFYACEEGNLDIIRYCVEHGANIKSLDKYGNTLLMCACEHGYLDVVKHCLEQGANINHTNERGVNGLMLACEEGYLSIIRYCIENGADTYAKNLLGSDILLIATDAGYFASFEYILNFNFERESLSKSFQIACSEYILEFVKLLTKKCRDILCDSECLAALFNSAYEGFFDIVQYCLEEGVDVNATLDGTCSLLLAAVEGGHVDIVRYLVHKGANVNYIYADGYTALLVASEAGHLDIVKYLVEQGADVNHTSHKHETALMVSVENRHKDIVEYLLDQYSNILHDLHSCVCALLSACRLLQPDIAFICLDYMERKKAITSNTIFFAALATMGSYFNILYKYSCHYSLLSDKNRLSYECTLLTLKNHMSAC